MIKSLVGKLSVKSVDMRCVAQKQIEQNESLLLIVWVALAHNTQIMAQLFANNIGLKQENFIIQFLRASENTQEWRC